MRILVADDDPGSRLVAMSVVQSLGHEGVAAADGEQAWSLFGTERPQMIVTDFLMPGLDGVELCRAVRAAEEEDPRHGYTYLVLITGATEPEDVLAGMEAGADDYIPKPLDPFQLQTKLLAAHRVTGLHAQLAQTRDLLARQAWTDSLTGLGNRQRLGEDLAGVDASSRRYGRPYSLAIVDVDHFKTYNDTYGHLAGDRALRAVAGVLATGLRASDRVYRWGGEEFLVVLPEQDLTGAAVVVDRLRRAVRDLAIEHRAAPRHGVLTVSVGLTCWLPGRTATVDQLFAEADGALYAAKAGGRDAVTTSPGPLDVR
jgi:two-component system chemotaxis response regulator CheY